MVHLKTFQPTAAHCRGNMDKNSQALYLAWSCTAAANSAVPFNLFHGRIGRIGRIGPIAIVIHVVHRAHIMHEQMLILHWDLCATAKTRIWRPCIRLYILKEAYAFCWKQSMHCIEAKIGLHTTSAAEKAACSSVRNKMRFRQPQPPENWGVCAWTNAKKSVRRACRLYKATLASRLYFTWTVWPDQAITAASEPYCLLIPSPVTVCNRNSGE